MLSLVSTLLLSSSNIFLSNPVKYHSYMTEQFALSYPSQASKLQVLGGTDLACRDPSIRMFGVEGFGLSLRVDKLLRDACEKENMSSAIQIMVGASPCSGTIV